VTGIFEHLARRESISGTRMAVFPDLPEPVQREEMMRIVSSIAEALT
jgi:hypothetical protein